MPKPRASVPPSYMLRPQARMRGCERCKVNAMGGRPDLTNYNGKHLQALRRKYLSESRKRMSGKNPLNSKLSSHYTITSFPIHETTARILFSVKLIITSLSFSSSSGLGKIPRLCRVVSSSSNCVQSFPSFSLFSA